MTLYPETVSPPGQPRQMTVRRQFPGQPVWTARPSPCQTRGPRPSRPAERWFLRHRSPAQSSLQRTWHGRKIEHGQFSSRHEVLFGGDGFIGIQTHLPPKLSFSSDFGHFILKMVENAKYSSVSRKKDAKISSFLGGGRPPLIFRLRGTRPPSPFFLNTPPAIIR